MSAKRIAIFDHGPVRQHGAALMVMLVILIVGAAAILVSTLTSSSLQIARDKTTADALAQAKDALIGRAVADTTSPGSLPCPDLVTNNPGPTGVINVPGDGIADSLTGNDCPSYIGRLPWKTLGLPDLRDGSGERLWYAVSSNFRDYVTTNPINSDTTGNLTISGATTANNVIAIVFAPGATISGQSRSNNLSNCTTTGDTTGSTKESLCATNYLEGTNSSPTWNYFSAPTAAINTNYQSSVSGGNDQMITITHDQLFAPVETRIAREAKQCLDNYAAISSNTNHRYPWAVPDTYYPIQTGIYNTLFGRIAATPLTTTQSIDSTATSMLTALSSLQTALNTYSASVNATTTSALLSSAQALITAAQNADNSGSFASYSSITGNADTAGDRARDLATGVGGYSVSTVQNYIDNTYSSLNSNDFIDGTMPIYWPSGCVFTSTYWNAWQKEVFYQVAAGNSPGTSVSVCNTSCLSVTGSGNPNSGSGTYRAAVIVGRAHTVPPNSSTATPATNPPSYYLEGSNLHDSTQNFSTTPQVSQNFVTYKPTDSSYSSINDLVLCLDGNNYCK